MRVEFKASPIQDAARVELTQGGAWSAGVLHPGLSWTHYRILLKVDRRAVRDFYEIEAIRNGWSARQLERQIASLLFERLAPSRDKKGVLALADEGQVLTRPQDAIKDPYVLEFLDLPEADRLVESRVEEARADTNSTYQARTICEPRCGANSTCSGAKDHKGEQTFLHSPPKPRSASPKMRRKSNPRARQGNSHDRHARAR